ncbi:MAG: hypothetical protein P8011_19335 [Acidihalobacter sp.]|jgi:hypothetical protein|uniref:hypothetical protein n=1 Tax=Acidihalobacter sp. TaxID=1872108 RepID=UPI00307CFF3C
MNTHGCRDCGSQYNTLASMLGTALYRSMNSSSENLGRGEAQTKGHAKKRRSFLLGFKTK